MVSSRFSIKKIVAMPGGHYCLLRIQAFDQMSSDSSASQVKLLGFRDERTIDVSHYDITNQCTSLLPVDFAQQPSCAARKAWLGARLHTALQHVPVNGGSGTDLNPCKLWYEEVAYKADRRALD
jgi:hypothetical protein